MYWISEWRSTSRPMDFVVTVCISRRSRRMMSKWRKDVVPLVEIQIPSRGLNLLQLTNWNNLFTFGDMSSQHQKKGHDWSTVCIFYCFPNSLPSYSWDQLFVFLFVFCFVYFYYFLKFPLQYIDRFLFIYLFRLDMHTQPPGQQTGETWPTPTLILYLPLLPVRCNEIQPAVYRVWWFWTDTKWLLHSGHG